MRVGKHFVDRDVLLGLDRARAALPAGPRPGLTLLRRFLDCALDKWDGRYDYHSYLALPVLSTALEGIGEITPGRARRHRDRRYLHLLTDLLRFELDVEAGRTDLLPGQRPDRDRLTKRLRLAVRAAQPVLARLSPLTTITATDPVAAAAEVCAAVDATTAERRDLRLSMLPVYVVHDEYLFLRVLQSYETTFALLVVLLRAARDALLRGPPRPPPSTSPPRPGRWPARGCCSPCWPPCSPSRSAPSGRTRRGPAPSSRTATNWWSRSAGHRTGNGWTARPTTLRPRCGSGSWPGS
ncbi:hypothetical protein [Micromonospora pallida]|uniref:hypothetical protein n=1 Tax=Micromonospora pallida TaxID=145854 RepID=UPI001FDEEAC3|nr:hypothetical protein [Micromonospora pallida]